MMHRSENMYRGRCDKILDQRVRIDGVVTTYRTWLATQPKVHCNETDAMFEWNRTRYNRMNPDEQRDYEARLKAQRRYWVNNVSVPKIVYEWALRNLTEKDG